MGSAIPGAVRAVKAALVANLPATVPVFLGPGVSDAPDRSYVQVGWQDPDSETFSGAVTGSQKWAQLGGRARDETFAIHCVAVAWNGDADADAAMTAVYVTFDAIGSALVADPTLGALLYAPGLTSHSLSFIQDADGVLAFLPFDIECRSRI